MVKCIHCGQENNKKNTEDHEGICFMRPKPCKYCE